jgi:hypothetical protein
MGWPFKKKSETIPVESPVDLNKPVENPILKKAINAYRANQNIRTQKDLGEALNSANYLIAIMTDEMTTTPSDTEGQVTINKGSLIKFINCFNENNECFLPAFTDWEEIRMWTTQEVGTLVMPADHLWGFALQDDLYAGVVINPAGTLWTMSKDNIKALQEDMKK